MQALSREKNFPTTISCLLDRNITFLEAFLGEICGNYINYHGMRYSYDLMLNIIDLPSLGHRRQLPPRTARQEKLLSCHCEVRVVSHRYWRCICNHQADTPLLFCYPPQLIWSALIIPTFLWRKPSASRLNAKLKEGVGSLP